MTQRYTIEIIADAPPRLCLGDVIAGGQIVGINCANDEPDIVSAAWLADRQTPRKLKRPALSGFLFGQNNLKIFVSSACNVPKIRT